VVGIAYREAVDGASLVCSFASGWSVPSAVSQYRFRGKRDQAVSEGATPLQADPEELPHPCRQI
jgi:hypothetical protein